MNLTKERNNIVSASLHLDIDFVELPEGVNMILQKRYSLDVMVAETLHRVAARFRANERKHRFL